MSETSSQYSEESDQSSDNYSDDQWQESDASGNNSDLSPAPSDDEINEDNGAVSDGDEPDELNWSETYEQIDIHPFIQNTGPTHQLPPNANELQFFKLFFYDAMLAKIVEETNRYAEQNGPDQHWVNTTPEEISAFIGMQILMGIVKVSDYSFYWSGNNFLANQGLKEIMPVKRYEKLNQYMHANNMETEVPPGLPGHDKLHKIRPLIDSSLHNFSACYNPNKNQSVDEAMVAYRGRYSAKQYIPSKPIKLGFKIWMRCDSKSGYCHQYDVYMGKEARVNGIKGLGHRVVGKLSHDLRNKHHHVYFDSYFTSIPLIIDLLRNGICSCGTIRQNRKGFPQALRTAPRLQTGQFVGRQTDDMVGVVWMDKKPVSVLASNESLTEVDTTNRRQKDGTNLHITRPSVITNYQEHFRGVDICDQLRTKYAIGRPSKKWWKYLMNFIIDLCLINSFFVMSEGPQLAHAKKRYRQLDYRINLAEQLIRNFARQRRQPVAQARRIHLGCNHAHVKLGRKRSTCKLCPKTGEKKRKTTQFGCEKCDKHLCSLECHNNFHRNIGILVPTEE